MANTDTGKDNKAGLSGKRKEKLEGELREIEGKLGHSVDNLRQKVEETRNRLSPAYWIRKYPSYALGAAAAIGFILAPSGRKRSRRSENSAPKSNGHQDQEAPRVTYKEPGMGVLLITELKRMATRKATDFLVNKIEDAIDKNFSEKEKKDTE